MANLFANMYFAAARAFCLSGSVSTQRIDGAAVYEASFGSLLSVLAIFRGGAVFSPSVGSCSRFFAAF